jgi:hypothetical protein
LGATEAFNQFATELADFAQRFGQPLQAAVAQFGQTLEDPPKDAKTAYDAFVTVMTAQYETFLGSPEGIAAVARIIEGYLNYKSRLDGATAPWLKFWAIPTKQEMTDVHRQLHDLKKQNRLQQAALDQQAGLIATLEQGLARLEAPDGTVVAPKKPVKGRSGARAKSGSATKAPGPARTAR